MTKMQTSFLILCFSPCFSFSQDHNSHLCHLQTTRTLLVETLFVREIGIPNLRLMYTESVKFGRACLRGPGKRGGIINFCYEAGCPVCRRVVELVRRLAS